MRNDLSSRRYAFDTEAPRVPPTAAPTAVTTAVPPAMPSPPAATLPPPRTARPCDVAAAPVSPPNILSEPIARPIAGAARSALGAAVATPATPTARSRVGLARLGYPHPG